MALGPAYGGVGIATGTGVPRIALKADGKPAIFDDLTQLKAHYTPDGVDYPEEGYAAIVGTKNVNGELTKLTAAYVWNFDTEEWDGVVNDLIGAKGEDGRTTIMKGLYNNATTYNRADLVRYQATGGSNKVGLYQCLTDGTVGKLPNADAAWILLLEETYVAPVHRVFKVETLFSSTPTSPAAINTPFTDVKVRWNVKEWAADDERITQVRVTDPDGTNHTATAAQLAANEFDIRKAAGWARPNNSHSASFSVRYTTNKGTQVTKVETVYWNNRYYYGFSALGDAGSPMTEVAAKALTVGNIGTYPQTVNLSRTTETAEYAYIIISMQDSMPNDYELRLFPALTKQGTLAIDSVQYQIYRTPGKTHTKSLPVRAN